MGKVLTIAVKYLFRVVFCVKFAQKPTFSEFVVIENSKWREQNGSVRRSCTVTVVYNSCTKNPALVKNIFFPILSQRNAQMVNLKNPNLDLI